MNTCTRVFFFLLFPSCLKRSYLYFFSLTNSLSLIVFSPFLTLLFWYPCNIPLLDIQNMSVCLACESEGATNRDDEWWYDFSSTYYLSGLRMTGMKYSMTLQRKKGSTKSPQLGNCPEQPRIRYHSFSYHSSYSIIPFYNSIWPQEQQRPRIGVWVFTGAFKCLRNDKATMTTIGVVLA